MVRFSNFITHLPKKIVTNVFSEKGTLLIRMLVKFIFKGLFEKIHVLETYIIFRKTRYGYFSLSQILSMEGFPETVLLLVVFKV